MAQYLRPSSDVAAGSWTTTPLYAKVDEASYDDVDYISGPNRASSTCQLGLSSVTDPASSTGHILRVRAYLSNTGLTLTFALYCGATLIKSWDPGITTGSFASYSYTLSAGEADAITNYGDLRFHCIQTYSSGTGTRRAYVSWVEMEVPNVAPTTVTPNVATLVASSQTVTVSAPLAPTNVAINVTALTANPQGAALVPGAVSISVNVTNLVASPQVITVNAPFPAVTANLNAVSLVSAAQTVSVIPGTVSIILGVASLTTSPPAITINAPTAGAKTTVMVTGWEHGVNPTTAGGGLGDVVIGNVTTQGTIKKNGNYAVKFVSGQAYVGYNVSSPTNIVISLYYYFETLPTASCSLAYGNTNTGVYVRFRFNYATSKFCLYNGSTTTDIVTAQTGVWYRIDYKATCTSSQVSATATVNGANETTLSVSTTNPTFNRVDVGLCSSGAGGTAEADDLIISETISDYPIGEHATQILIPTGDGTSVPGTVIKNTGGNVIDGTTYPAYTELDEMPISDTNTYIQQSAVDDTKYAEVTFGNTDMTSIIGVEGLLAYRSSDVNANYAKAYVRDAAGQQTAVYSGDMSENTMRYSRSKIAIPAAGWSKTTVDGLVGRVGYASIIDAIPWWMNLAIEVAYVPPESQTVSLNAATLSAQAQAVTVDAPITPSTVAINVATLVSTAQTETTVPGAIAISVSTSTLTTQAQLVEAKESSATLVYVAQLTSTPQSILASTPEIIILSVASINANAQAIIINVEDTVIPVSSGTLVANPQTTTIVSGAVIVNVTTGTLTASAQKVITYPYDAKNLNGLVAWHEADHLQGYTDGADVTSWTDSSGNNHIFDENNGNDWPTYQVNVKNGLPVLRLVGTSYQTLQADSADNVFHDAWRNAGYGALFCVFKPSSATLKGDVMFIQNGGSVGRLGFAVSETGYTGKFTLFGRRLDADTVQFVPSSQTITAGNWYIVSVLVEWANAIAHIRVNGAPGGESHSFKTAGNTSDTRSVMVDIGSSGGASFFTGDIGECIWYNGQVTEADASKIETYLNNKWVVYTENPVVSLNSAQLTASPQATTIIPDAVTQTLNVSTVTAVPQTVTAKEAFTVVVNAAQVQSSTDVTSVAVGAVDVGLATVNLQAVTQAVTVTSMSMAVVGGATLVTSPQNITIVAGAVTVTLQNASIVTSAQNITAIPGASAFSLNSVILNAISQNVSATEAFTFSINSAVLQSSIGIITTVPGAFTLAVNGATTQVQAQTVTAVGGAIVAQVNAAQLSTVTQNVSAITPEIVLVNSAVLLSQTQVITPVGGAVTVTVNVVELQATAQVTTEVTGATFISLNVATIQAQPQIISFVLGEVTVSVNSASLLASAQYASIQPIAVTVTNLSTTPQLVTIVTGAVVVQVSTTQLNSAAQNVLAITPEIVLVSTANLNTNAQASTVFLGNAPQTIVLTAATLVSSAINIVASTPETVLLAVTNLTTEAQNIEIVTGEAIVVVSSSTILSASQAISIPLTVYLASSQVNTIPQTVSLALGAVTVSVNVSSLTTTPQTVISVAGAVTVQITSSQLNAISQTSTVVPGAISIIVSVSNLYSNAQAISIDAPAPGAIQVGTAQISSATGTVSIGAGAVTIIVDVTQLNTTPIAITVVPGTVTLLVASSTLVSSVNIIDVSAGIEWLFVPITSAVTLVSPQTISVSIYFEPTIVNVSGTILQALANNVTATPLTVIEVFAALLAIDGLATAVIPGSVSVIINAATIVASSRASVPYSIDDLLNLIRLHGHFNTVISLDNL